MWRLLQVLFIACSVFLASLGPKAIVVSAVTSVLLTFYVSRRRHQKNARTLLPEFRLSSATYLVIASIIMRLESKVTTLELLTHDFLLVVWGWLSALPCLLERSDCLAPNYPPFSSSDPVWLPLAAIVLQLVLAVNGSLKLLTSACTPTMHWDWFLLPADCSQVFKNKWLATEYVTSALCLLHAALTLLCLLCSRMTSPTVMTQCILKKLKEEQEAMGRYFKGDNSKPRRLLLVLTLLLPPAHYCALDLPIGCRGVRRVVSPWDMPRLNPPSRDPYCQPRFDVKEVPLQRVETWEEAEKVISTHTSGSWLGGGSWEPGSCRPWQRVAIIVPFRHRDRQLVQLLATLHPFLQRQLASYTVFVVEQAGEGVFNRGKVKDAGFLEAERRGPFHCYVFHDVDMLPERQDNLYLCDVMPRHLCPALDEMRYNLPFSNLLGGVVAMTGGQFRQANGYPTLYWGWGGEDDDLSARWVHELGMTITQPPNHIGRYRMLRHVKDTHNSLAHPLFRTWKNRWKEDGISNPDLMHYSLVSEKEHRLYTHLVVDVGEPPSHLETWLQGTPVTSFWIRQFYKC